MDPSDLPAKIGGPTTEISAFEAAFGDIGARSGNGALIDGMDVDLDPTRPKWQQLFDAPSHALPAPTALALTFLRLVSMD